MIRTLDTAPPEAQDAGVTTTTFPAQRDGWTVLGAWQTGVNGSWVVTARRGSQALRVDRLTAADVASFDAAARWAGGR